MEIRQSLLALSTDADRGQLLAQHGYRPDAQGHDAILTRETHACGASLRLIETISLDGVHYEASYEVYDGVGWDPILISRGIKDSMRAQQLYRELLARSGETPRPYRYR